MTITDSGTLIPDPLPASGGKDPVHHQLRGSSLLLAGRGFALGVNFLVQVLMVRYLVTQDYGALAYALGVVAFLQHVSTLGLRSGLERFVPIYHEQGENGKLLGATLLGFFTATIFSLAMIVAVFASPDFIAHIIRDEQRPMLVLMVLIFMVPVEAFDDLLLSLFASFGRSRAIFFRRHIVGPALKLLAIVATMALEESVGFLASAYVAAGAIGLVVYMPVLFSLLRSEGILARDVLRGMRVPAAELFSFSLPLLATELMVGLAPLVAIMVLGYYHDLTQVALFRAVLPLATLNRTVKLTFETLYAPTAARLFARNDAQKLNDLYWRTTAWVSVLSFPIFAITFSAARPLVATIYGPEYHSSWVILTLLSLAYFVHSAFGFNSLTLQVMGKLRFVVTLSVLSSLANILLTLVLVPRYGALGAAIATASVLIAHTVVRQIALGRMSSIHSFDPAYVPLYTRLGACAAALLAVQQLFGSHRFLALLLSAAAAGLVVFLVRRTLSVGETFPELMRWRLARLVFAR